MTSARLVDLNIWLALLDQDHVHHPHAKRWMRAVGPGEALLCGVAQLSLLRLLTNSKAMREVPRSPCEAWRGVSALRTDERVAEVEEPPGVFAVMRTLTEKETGLSGSSWTDAYLAAFAIAGGYALATYDKQIAKRYPVKTEVVA